MPACHLLATHIFYMVILTCQQKKNKKLTIELKIFTLLYLWWHQSQIGWNTLNEDIYIYIYIYIYTEKRLLQDDKKRQEKKTHYSI